MTQRSEGPAKVFHHPYEGEFPEHCLLSGLGDFRKQFPIFHKRCDEPTQSDGVILAAHLVQKFEQKT